MMIKNALEFRNCGEAGQVSFQSNFWIVRVLKAIHEERDFLSSSCQPISLCNLTQHM